MTTVEIFLPDSLKEFIEHQVAAGGYRDASEYMQSLLEDARIAQRRAEIDGELLKRLDAVDRGEASEMTAQDWQNLRIGLKEEMGKRNGS